ncbi:MAG TPA: hypothetical protein VFP65_01035 [Anaeromyxobacteraceae bacterium]|nr:hypothetical protein [Anaeromyxobacteraceae bacterium]
MARAIVGALAACLTVGAAMTQAAAPEGGSATHGDRRIASAVPAPPAPARINKVVPRPCGPARAIRCDAPENDDPLPPWSEDTKRRVHEDCHDHMFGSVFPRWKRDKADEITQFYCDCLVDYAEQAMPEREAFAESGFGTYQVAKSVCARQTVGKYPSPQKPPPVNPFHT